MVVVDVEGVVGLVAVVVIADVVGVVVAVVGVAGFVEVVSVVGFVDVAGSVEDVVVVCVPQPTSAGIINAIKAKMVTNILYFINSLI